MCMPKLKTGDWMTHAAATLGVFGGRGHALNYLTWPHSDSRPISPFVTSCPRVGSAGGAIRIAGRSLSVVTLISESKIPVSARAIAEARQALERSVSALANA